MWSGFTSSRRRRRWCSASTSRVELRRGASLAAGPFPRPSSEPDVPVPEHPALHDLSRSTGDLSPAHRCSLVCIRSTVASAASGVGHCAPMFIGDLLPLQHFYCGVAVCLRHVGGDGAEPDHGSRPRSHGRAGSGRTSLVV